MKRAFSCLKGHNLAEAYDCLSLLGYNILLVDICGVYKPDKAEKYGYRRIQHLTDMGEGLLYASCYQRGIDLG